MERRKSPRVQANTTATLTTLGNDRATYSVRVADCSDRGLRLECPSPLRVDQAVQIESGDVLLLAEVCYCGPAAPGSAHPYSAGVMTRQVLSGLASLHYLISAFTPVDSTQPASPRR